MEKIIEWFKSLDFLIDWIRYFLFSPEWIQVFISGFAVFLAMDYLSQHAKKAKVEKRYDLINSCMNKISQYLGEQHLFYKSVTSHHYLFYIENKKPQEIVDLIIEQYYRDRLNMKSIDFLTFEIDTEIQLISDPEISKLWKELFDKISEVRQRFDNLYQIKGDFDKCMDFIMNMPLGIISRETLKQSEIVDTKLKLMKELLNLYRKQEHNMTYRFFIGFRRKDK